MQRRSSLDGGRSGVRLLTLMFLGAALGCASNPATEAGASASASPADGSPPGVHGLVRAMSDHLASESAFSFHAETNFEIVDDGQKLQFAGAADVSVRRPNKLYVDYRDDLAAKRAWYDGSQFTLLDVPRNMYATLDAPAELDDALDYLERKYDVTMPLSELVGSDAYAAIASAARSGSYVGLHDVDGVACHHLAFVGETADFQLWIQDGPRPDPCKLVIDYKQEPGRPQYVVVMMDWEFDQELPDSSFVAILPQGARKLDFLALGEARR